MLHWTGLNEPQRFALRVARENGAVCRGSHNPGYYDRAVQWRTIQSLAELGLLNVRQVAPDHRPMRVVVRARDGFTVDHAVLTLAGAAVAARV